MKDNHDIFLSMSDAEKLSLFRTIIDVREAQTPVKKRVKAYRDHRPLVSEVNLKQVAAITNRNYGSVYNTYNGLMHSLETMIGREHASVKTLLGIPVDEFRYYLVKQSNPYHFLDAVLYQRYEDFDDFLRACDSSKATVLRHLKVIRGYARQSGVQFSYETLSFVGAELNVRLFITIAYWLATNGVAWPFENLSHDRAGEILDDLLVVFDSGKVNKITRELLMYYIAVAHQRILSGHVLSHEAGSKVLQYPVPNLFSDAALSLLDKSKRLQHLTTQQQQSESDALYFLFNFAPLYIITDGQVEQRIIARYNDYNPEIYQLINGFFTRFPYNFKLDIHLPDDTYNLLFANMLSVTVSVLAFNKDFSTSLLAEVSANMQQTKDDPDFYQQVKVTLNEVIDSQQLTSFVGCRDVLAEAFYRNLHQLLVQFQPQQKVLVAPVIEQTVTGYIDLLAFLHAVPFVELASPDADLKDVDLIITTSVGAIKDAAGQTQIFPWHINVTNDHYGHLYSLLRELWDGKTLKDARFIY